MRRLLRYVGTVMKAGMLLSTLGFVACILLQIFARLFLATAPSWTEEAARVFFVLAVGFAAGPALRSGGYVRFDFFYRRLSPAWQRRLDLTIDLLTIVLFALFTFYAARFTGMGWAERSPSLRFPMAVPFAGTLVLGVSLLLFALGRLWRYLRTNASRR